MSELGSTQELGRRQLRSVIAVGLLVFFAASFLPIAPASAAVTVSRAELSGSDLRIEGTAIAARDIAVDGVIMGRSDSDGKFRIERSS